VIDVMAALNRDAGEAMVAANANAGTDITGFGVLGHVLEMARSAGVTMRIESGAVPWMDGLSDHISKKNTCGGLTRNLQYAKDFVSFEGGTAEQQSVLADPQTSGGLLISVPAARVDALLRDLEARGVETRAVVGEVVARGTHDVVVF
jgi:selenide,water dikinase